MSAANGTRSTQHAAAPRQASKNCARAAHRRISKLNDHGCMNAVLWCQHRSVRLCREGAGGGPLRTPRDPRIRAAPSLVRAPFSAADPQMRRNAPQALDHLAVRACVSQGPAGPERGILPSIKAWVAPHRQRAAPIGFGGIEIEEGQRCGSSTRLVCARPARRASAGSGGAALEGLFGAADVVARGEASCSRARARPHCWPT